MLTRDLTLLNICNIASLICVKYMLHNGNIYAVYVLSLSVTHICDICDIGLTECQLYQKYIYAEYIYA